MLNTKLKIWLVLLTAFSLNCQADKLNDVEKYFDKLLSYQLDFKAEEQNIWEAVKEVELALQKDENSAFLWYLKGRSSWVQLYITEKGSPEYQKIKEQIPLEYEMALALNEDAKTLSGHQLNQMMGSYRVTELAAKQLIELKVANETLQDKEHITIYREKIVPSLIKQNKLEEARKSLDFIDEKFPQFDQGETGNTMWRTYFLDEISKQEQLIRTSDNTKVKPAKSPASPREKVEVLEKESSNIAVDEEGKLGNDEKVENGNILYILVVVILIFVVIVFMFGRKK